MFLISVLLMVLKSTQNPLYTKNTVAEAKKKKKKKRERDGGVDVMQSQNTPSPSPQNKIEMESTNLIFTLLLLRFPVFLLLQSSVFSFCNYSSCFFGVSFLPPSLVPKTAKPREIRSLRFFFFFANKVVYQYGRHYPFSMKRLDI